ncbi:hypothetical protein GCM10010335_29100 [Streptomyces galbus]|nr:hypothetical protein GCM10010335_29100 [Streptomyces galbus]
MVDEDRRSWHVRRATDRPDGGFTAVPRPEDDWPEGDFKARVEAGAPWPSRSVTAWGGRWRPSTRRPTWHAGRGRSTWVALS